MKSNRAAGSLLWMLLGSGVALADDGESGVLNNATLARAVITEIEKINHDLTEVRAAQEKAWPTREEDQANEKPSPPEVQKLHLKQVALERRRERRAAELRKLSATDLVPILDVLRKTKSRTLLAVLVPIAIDVGRNDPRVLKILKALERRFDECPTPVVNGLAALGNEDASLSVLELGLKEKNLSVLVAAGKTGDPTVVGQLITAAQSDDETLAAVCRRALLRLTPPRNPGPSLVGLLLQRLPDVKSSELQATLIVYVGLCKSKESVSPLMKLYRETRDVGVRVAIIGALANTGTPGIGKFVFSQLKLETLPAPIETSCIHALGSLRYRPAIPHLIELMDDSMLSRTAARALSRIAGQDLGQNKGRWVRWWRSQPEANVPAEQ